MFVGHAYPVPGDGDKGTGGRAAAATGGRHHQRARRPQRQAADRDSQESGETTQGQGRLLCLLSEGDLEIGWDLYYVNELWCLPKK